MIQYIYIPMFTCLLDLTEWFKIKNSDINLLCFSKVLAFIINLKCLNSFIKENLYDQ